MKLAGILYLHEITQGNMDSGMLGDLEVLRQLCGEDAEKNVILVTTKWAEILQRWKKNVRRSCRTNSGSQ
jgi:hypothetical protein